MSWGVFIAFEGIDGAGTTTQARLLARVLETNQIPVHLTAEPSQGAIGQFLRQALQDATLDPRTDALLFAADRVEHTYKEILPAVHDNRVVISDRYVLSTICYQAASGKVDPAWIRAINQAAIEPDLTIILDCDPRVSLARITRRGPGEKFETAEYLEAVRASYKQHVNPPEVVEVNADHPPARVFADIIAHVEEVLGCDLEVDHADDSA